jgi:hypothetical protein
LVSERAEVSILVLLRAVALHSGDLVVELLRTMAEYRRGDAERGLVSVGLDSSGVQIAVTGHSIHITDEGEEEGATFVCSGDFLSRGEVEGDPECIFGGRVLVDHEHVGTVADSGDDGEDGYVVWYAAEGDGGGALATASLSELLGWGLQRSALEGGAAGGGVVSPEGGGGMGGGRVALGLTRDGELTFAAQESVDIVYGQMARLQHRGSGLFRVNMSWGPKWRLPCRVRAPAAALYEATNGREAVRRAFGGSSIGHGLEYNAMILRYSPVRSALALDCASNNQTRARRCPS